MIESTEPSSPPAVKAELDKLNAENVRRDSADLVQATRKKLDSIAVHRVASIIAPRKLATWSQDVASLSVDIESQPHVISVHEDPLIPGSRGLVLKIEPVIPSGEYRSMSRSTTLGNIVGDAWHLKIHTPDWCEPKHEALLESIAATYKAGDEWLRVRVLEAFERAEAGSTGRLYAQLRAHLPESVHNNIFLFVVNSKEGRYLLDGTVARSILDRAKSDKRDTRSPLRVLAALEDATVRKSRDEFLSEAALSQSTALRGCFGDVRYAEETKTAEQIVIGSDRFVVQSLAKHGSVGLTVVYPASVEREVRPIAIGQRTQIERIVQQEFGEVSRLRAASSGASGLWDSLARPVGAMLAEFVKGLANS